MSYLQRKNSDKSKFGNHIDKVPIVLSKVQTRNTGKCKETRNIRYQSASRLRRRADSL